MVKRGKGGKRGRKDIKFLILTTDFRRNHLLTLGLL